jgi:hypothetical protein
MLAEFAGGLPASSGVSVAPESRPPLSMRHGDSFGLRFPGPDHEVIRESAKLRTAQTGIERLETTGSDGDRPDQAFQLIEKALPDAQTALGVPLDGFLAIPHGGRMESDGCWHQARERLRS